MTKPHIEIFTDGACSGNPGPGGWGAILRSGKHEKEMSGGEAATTNNRMELMAAIRALEAVKQPSTVKLHTAAAASDARIPGLEHEEAARLRDRLAALGEAKAAGL